MEFDLQPTLGNHLVILRPLETSDFEALYAVASDPLIWEQHPNPLRYQRPVFANYFQGAMESGGALLAMDAVDRAVIGSSRFYDLRPEEGIVTVGYTFLARSHWGGVYNRALKNLMLDHAFQRFDTVELHIGEYNLRSQNGNQKIGARKIGERLVEYYGEPPKLNYIYHIRKADWLEAGRPS